MVTLLLTILIISYVIFVIALARFTVYKEEEVKLNDLERIERDYEKLIHRKKQIKAQKKFLQEEANDIFVLYELTKDVAKNFDEEEAFKTFRERLENNISFEECLFLDPLSNEIRKLKASGDYFVFILKSKRRRLGALALKGLIEEDKDKLVILGHQFALALRRIKLYHELERLAITDSLTGLHTRRYLWDRFEEELNRAKLHNIKLSFLIVDVDHFKKFNDKHGHLTGDQILFRVSEIIRENIREIDIAGRYGGEEFCVVLPDTDSNGAQYVAERIRANTEETLIKAYDTAVNITVSIGLSNYPQDGSLVEELFDKADWALYRAKKMGRNRICAFGVYNK